MDQHLSRLISGIKSILEPEESKEKQTILQASSEKETDSLETHHLAQETPKNSKNTKRMIYIILLLLLAAGVSYIYLNQIQEKTVIHENKNKDNSKVAKTDFKINSWRHLKSESKDLYKANITVNNKNKTYRIYCPTEMVRDITNGNWDKSRTATDEDKIKFSGNFIVRKAMRKICN